MLEANIENPIKAIDVNVENSQELQQEIDDIDVEFEFKNKNEYSQVSNISPISKDDV